MTKTKNVLLPFVGFYESIASDRVEDTAFWNYISENDIKENKEGRMDVPEDMTEAQQEDFWDNYYPKHCKELRQEVAESYIHLLNGELDINAKFESIDSPQYYNYTTDRLFVDVPAEELIKLYNRVDQSILSEMIKEKHTSRPGFDSFYENDINDESWQNPVEYDHNQWETVIEAYTKQNGIEVEELYY